MDIVFYTKPAILNHKKKKGMVCFWKMATMPRDFKIGEKIYFATDGKIRGCFICMEINTDEKKIIWYSDTWEPLGEPIPLKRRHWRGFAYRWW